MRAIQTSMSIWRVFSSEGPLEYIHIEDTLVNYMEFDCSTLLVSVVSLDINGNPDVFTDVTTDADPTCTLTSFEVDWARPIGRYGDHRRSLGSDHRSHAQRV